MSSDLIIQTLITVVGTVLASSGFWMIIQKRMEKKDNRSRLMLGIGHDRIIYLGTQYIERGYITADEYENLYDYLYIPYKNMGGNGSAEKIIEEVKKLEVRKG